MQEEKLEKIIILSQELNANQKQSLANQEKAVKASSEIKDVYKKLVKKILIFFLSFLFVIIILAWIR